MHISHRRQRNRTAAGGGHPQGANAAYILQRPLRQTYTHRQALAPGIELGGGSIEIAHAGHARHLGHHIRRHTQAGSFVRLEANHQLRARVRRHLVHVLKHRQAAQLSLGIAGRAPQQRAVMAAQDHLQGLCSPSLAFAVAQPHIRHTQQQGAYVILKSLGGHGPLTL
ncbi:hypothetical protein D3C72_1343240 [compost metagenome]